MKRLIQINSVSNYGSTGKIMEAIGLLAQAEGWESMIATGSRYSQPSRLPTYTISSKWQNRFSAADSLLTGRHGFANNNETYGFIEWLKGFHPDVVHLHNVHSYFINIPQLFGYLTSSSVPVVWTLHDCWPFTGHCSHFITVDCQKWKTGCSNCPLIHSFPKSLLFDRSARNYRDKKHLFTDLKSLQIVTVSDWLGQIVKQSFLGQYPVEVIPNGIDLNLFKPRETSIRSKYGLLGKTVLLGVSTGWCSAKGLNDYVRLRHELPIDQYAIVLVGMDKKLIQKYQEPGLVCVERTTDADSLVEWYNAADVVLNISYAETFGLPVVEGFACGKPAIVYDNTALPELVDEDTGVIVETGNIQALVSAVSSVTSGGYTSQACRNRSTRLYDRDKNYRRYLDIYNHIKEMTSC